MTEILNALFIDKYLTESTLEAAQELVEAQPAPPRWLQALANGNPNHLSDVWEIVVEMFCYEQLEQLGFQVKLESRE